VAPDKQLLHISIDRELLDRIDDYRFAHRFPTRAGAIKWLLHWALARTPPPDADRHAAASDALAASAAAAAAFEEASARARPIDKPRG
jgi:hypothetical protein